MVVTNAEFSIVFADFFADCTAIPEESPFSPSFRMRILTVCRNHGCLYSGWLGHFSDCANCGDKPYSRNP